MARIILKWIVGLLEVLSSLMLVIMMVLTFVDVMGRYVIGKPVFGASEMISTLLAFLIFLGVGLANARDKHIVVELVDSHFRALSPRLYDWMVQGFSIAAMCVIVFVLFEQAVEAAHRGSATIVLEWPFAWITGIVAGLAALSVVCQVLGLVTGEARRSDHHLEDF